MPKSTKRKVRTSIYIDADVHEQLSLIYYNPVSCRMEYGVLTQLINQKLREHLNELELNQEREDGRGTE